MPEEFPTIPSEMASQPAAAPAPASESADSPPQSTPAEQKGTDPGALEALQKERDDALARLKDAEAKAAASVPAFLQSPPPVHQESMQAPPAMQTARDYASELHALDKKLEEGDISISEYQVAQRGILDQKYTEQYTQTIQEQLQKHSATMAARNIESAFLEENPDFTEFRNSGKLAAVQKAAKWGGIHDEVSGYFAHKWQSEVAAKDEAIKAAVSKATKDTEDRLRAEFRAKGGALTLGGGSSSVPPAETDRGPVSDGKRSVVQILAERHAQRRASTAKR